MIQPTSSGLVTHSAVNPTDEIPVGPQVYPYGTPKLAESRVNPYLSTSYQKTITAIPTATNVEVVQPVTTVKEVAVATPVVQTPVAAVQEVAVATPVVQTPVAVVQEVAVATPVVPVAAVQQAYQSPLLVSQIGYQKVMRYVPVAKTALVPRVTTSYATVPVGTIVGDVGTVVGNVAPAVAAPVVQAPVVPAPAVAAPVVANPVLTQSVVANPVLTQSVVANPVLTQSVVANPVLTGSVVSGPVVPPVLPQAGVALPDSGGHYVNGPLGR